MFTEKLRMKQLAQALERARTVDEWWQLLTAAGREWDWVRLKWVGQGGFREETLAARKSSWSFVVELTVAESLHVEGDVPAVQTAAYPPDLIALAAILSRTFQRGLREWRQPALS